MQIQTPMEYVTSGVDWLTATCLLDKTTDGSELERATELAAKMLREQEAAGNRLFKFNFRGFDGMSSGGVAVGRSGRGYLFRLSGQSASDYWRPVYEISTNVSRLDVQATWRLNGPWCDLTRIHQQEAEQYRAERAPHMKVSRIDGGPHGSTLYVGSRSSDAFGRAYMKGVQSRSDAFRDCYRYEVEYKRDFAAQAAAQLAAEELHQVEAGVMASQWFRCRAISSPQVLKTVALPRRCLERSDDAKSLDWLRTHVARSTARLLARGRAADVLKALGLTDSVLSSAGYVRASTTEPSGEEGVCHSTQ